MEKFSECNEKCDNSLDSTWATRKLKAKERERAREKRKGREAEKSERNALVNSILDDFLDFLFAKATVARCAMNFNFSFSYRYAISAIHTHTHTETKWQIHKSEVNSFLALAEAVRPPSRLARIIQFNCRRRRRCWCWCWKSLLHVVSVFVGSCSCIQLEQELASVELMKSESQHGEQYFLYIYFGGQWSRLWKSLECPQVEQLLPIAGLTNWAAAVVVAVAVPVAVAAAAVASCPCHFSVQHCVSESSWLSLSLSAGIASVATCPHFSTDCFNYGGFSCCCCNFNLNFHICIECAMHFHYLSLCCRTCYSVFHQSFVAKLVIPRHLRPLRPL